MRGLVHLPVAKKPYRIVMSFRLWTLYAIIVSNTGFIARTHLPNERSPQSDTGLRRYAHSPILFPDADVNKSENPESM